MSKIAISGASTGSATFTIESPATSTNRTLTLPDNTGTIITQNSTPAFASTIGVGGATAAASGAGITFPATQSASTDANTLDDYEEGSFTPVIAGATTDGTANYTAQVGRYTKIGNVVTCVIHFNWDSGTGTGNLLIKGMPFAAANDSAFPMGSFYLTNVAFTAGWVPQNYIAPNDTTINFFQVNGGVSSAISYDAAGVIVGTIVYRTA